MRLTCLAFAVLASLTTSVPAHAATTSYTRPVAATIEISGWGPGATFVDLGGDAATPEYSCVQSVSAIEVKVTCTRIRLVDGLPVPCVLCQFIDISATLVPQCGHLVVHTITSGIVGGAAYGQAGCASDPAQQWTAEATSIHGGPNPYGATAATAFAPMTADRLVCVAGNPNHVSPPMDQYDVTCTFAG